MAIGTLGSTFIAELNRLANGGTYPAISAWKADNAAANAWAGTTGLELLGALNQKAQAGRSPKAYKGLTAVCNELAGTTGLEAIPALREVAS